ncbi:ribokinase [Photobacterium sp. OFAV2-7]|uniref:ribokinase n=1 Tax=Photobacterium sp. OFAV2-7 TaxID=2917748 RepID=UPI001EF43462|nr:ribokinase [Photobacterium sp. OFAV2-7]MCG7588003.1 ribokinase [Photobacterium sp. OFAV2-7]
MSVFILGSYAKALVMTTDRIPLVGETLIGEDFRQTFGGKGSDMAVQAARLGADVYYSGVVGNDTFGTEFRELMKQEGVNTDALRVTDELATGAGLIIKDNNAQNVIVVDMGANKLYDKNDVFDAKPLMNECKVALAQLEIPLETALYGLKIAKSLGKQTVFNPAPARDLRGLDLSNIDYLTPNETEARVAIGLAPDDPISNREVADRLLETGCKAIVMTLGEHGSAVFTQETTITVPPCLVDVVDSNGAGDSFNAALSVALSEEMDIADAVQFANATAALCCTQWETVPSYYNRLAVDAFLAEQ